MWLYNTEREYKKLFGKAKSSVAKGKDMRLEAIHVCEMCGYTLEGEAPEKCPLCGASREHLRKFS